MHCMQVHYPGVFDAHVMNQEWLLRGDPSAGDLSRWLHHLCITSAPLTCTLLQCDPPAGCLAGPWLSAQLPAPCAQPPALIAQAVPGRPLGIPPPACRETRSIVQVAGPSCSASVAGHGHDSTGEPVMELWNTGTSTRASSHTHMANVKTIAGSH